MRDAVYLDADISNADSIKTRWPYDTVDESLYYVLGNGPPEEQRQNFDSFMTFPVARFMPTDVKQALAREGFIVPRRR